MKSINREKIVNPLNMQIVFMLFSCGFFVLNEARGGPIAEGASKFLGNISTATPPSNFLNYWNQVTLENNGKWVNVEGSRDNMQWGNISGAYNYCRQNKIPFKHHCFVWKEQAPSWITSLSNADIKAEVEEWIRLFGEKFPETEYIDVVNESREKSPAWKTALGGDGATGCDWIVWAFETARKYCPKAKLLINEYYCEKSLEYVTQYLKIINVLKAKNLIDGVGLQTHDSETKEGYKTGVLKKCLDSLATSGVDLYSTEFDLSGNDTEQLNYYKNIFPIIWEHPAIKGVTLWGWTDSWLLQLSPPKDARLIINGQERPALKWLREYVASHKIPATIARAPEKDKAVSQIISADFLGNGFVRMDLDIEQDITIKIINSNGKIVFSQGERSFSRGSHAVALPTQRLGQGFYLMVIRSKTANFTRKIFIGS
jgi:endo-1,4-beta-xylanase